jgi:hypothetical protein
MDIKQWVEKFGDPTLLNRPAVQPYQRVAMHQLTDDSKAKPPKEGHTNTVTIDPGGDRVMAMTPLSRRGKAQYRKWLEGHLMLVDEAILSGFSVVMAEPLPIAYCCLSDLVAARRRVVAELQKLRA